MLTVHSIHQAHNLTRIAPTAVTHVRRQVEQCLRDRRGTTGTLPPPPDGALASSASGSFDSGDVDLFHGHHGIEGAFCLVAAGGQSVGEGARSDLPVEAPAVFAPAA